METSLRNTPALLNHIDKLTSQFVERFYNIIQLAALPKANRDLEDEDAAHGPDKELAAANTFKMQVEVAALVRASEDFLSLIRQMKDMWLFGHLNTLQASGGEDITRQDARLMADLLSELSKEGKLGYGI